MSRAHNLMKVLQLGELHVYINPLLHLLYSHSPLNLLFINLLLHFLHSHSSHFILQPTAPLSYSVLLFSSLLHLTSLSNPHSLSAFSFTPHHFIQIFPPFYSNLQHSLISKSLYTSQIYFFYHSPSFPFIIFPPLQHSSLLLFPIPQHPLTITILSFPLSDSLLLPFTLLHSILLHSPYYIPPNSLNPIIFSIHNFSFIIFPTITFHFIIFTLYYTHFTTHPLYYIISYHITTYIPPILLFITLLHSILPLKVIFFPFPTSPEYPFLLLLCPLPHFHLSLKKILPYIHNLYHFTSHITLFSILLLSFFNLLYLPLNLSFISFHLFIHSYSLIYLTSLITPHLNTIYFHLDLYKFHLHTSTQSQVLTIIYILTKLTIDNHPNNHHTSNSY